MNNQNKNYRWDVAKIGLWALQILTAAAFLLAGVAKLIGQPMMVETFEKVGVGQWFRYATGAIEVASAKPGPRGQRVRSHGGSKQTGYEWRNTDCIR
jgi:hypothetical protein